jgi:hypothetical protein
MRLSFFFVNILTMNFDYKYPPFLGAGVITNLFQPKEMLTIQGREEFNIPLPSRPELAALHVVNPGEVDESFRAADRRQGHLILRRPIVGDSDKSPEIQGIYQQSDAKRGALGLEFLLKPVENKPHYQVYIDTQFPQSNERLSPEEAAHMGDFLYKLINLASKTVTEKQASLPRVFAEVNS